MSRTKILTLGLILSVGVALGVATIGQAKLSDNIQAGNNISVASDQVHQGSLYVAGERIVVDGIVEGDLYCAGRDLVINGTVMGDVLCAVQSATINGAVRQDIRLAGQYANISSEVGGSVTFFGQDLKIFNNGSIMGDLNGAAQNVMISGPVGRSVLIGAQNLTLQSVVGGNVDAAIERVDLMTGAEVVGDFNYHASSKLSVDESMVGGTINYTQSDNGRGFGGLAFMFVSVFSMLVCALVIILLAPRFVERSRGIARTNTLMVGLIGFAALVGAPILAIMLMVTVVLLPLGFMVLALWFATLVASQALFAYLLGSLVFAQQSSVLVRGTAGVAILFVLYLIPVLNAFVALAGLILGTGMVVSTVLDGYRRPSYKIEEPVKKKSKKE